jgi:hypothetical protein
MIFHNSIPKIFDCVVVLLYIYPARLANGGPVSPDVCRDYNLIDNFYKDIQDARYY